MRLGLNKRRRVLLKKLVLNTRINKDFIRSIHNHVKKFLLNKEHALTVTYPTNAMLELGNVCNLHCSMCPREFEYGKSMDVGFMPLDKLKKIIDEIYPYLDSIGLTGLGETFLYPHMLETVKYIKSKKKSIIITVSTNAHFKGYKEKVEPVLPYIDNIQFSIDGIGDTYDQIRQGASFAEVNDNIQFTIDKGKDVTFMLNCVVVPENHMQMKDIVEYAHQQNIDYVNFNCASIASDPNRSRDYYDFFSSKEYLDSVREVQETAKRYKHMEVTGPNYPSQGTFRDCIYPWEYPYITWDGYYVPCCGKPFPKLLHFGNVFEDGVMNTLNSPKAQSFRRLWQKNTPPSFCHNCQLTKN
ncbi:MAG: radical SAM protein [Bacteroidaceae bacterium]|nr:radical SAM protein [Bacteroidaceae bacterium]